MGTVNGRTSHHCCDEWSKSGHDGMATVGISDCRVVDAAAWRGLAGGADMVEGYKREVAGEID